MNLTRNSAQQSLVPRPKPLTHYTVKEPALDDTYYTLPDSKLLRWLRHQWVLERRERPMVPVFHKQPLPSKSRGGEQNARLCNAYILGT